MTGILGGFWGHHSIGCMCAIASRSNFIYFIGFLFSISVYLDNKSTSCASAGLATCKIALINQVWVLNQFY